MGHGWLLKLGQRGGEGWLTPQVSSEFRHLCRNSVEGKVDWALISLGFLEYRSMTGGASQVALMVKNPPANAGDGRDTGSIPGSGRSPGGRHGNPLQYSCLENPMDRGTWKATVHRVAKSWTRLKRLSTHALVQSNSPGWRLVVRASSTSQRGNWLERARMWTRRLGARVEVEVWVDTADYISSGQIYCEPLAVTMQLGRACEEGHHSLS